MLPLSEDGRDPWKDHALCTQTDPEIFFPEKSHWKQSIRAKLVCQKCPVQPECLAHALKHNEQYGVWGGKTARQRQELRRQPCGG
jgi:WhiB family redox-sensing transcriptional regulator